MGKMALPHPPQGLDHLFITFPRLGIARLPLAFPPPGVRRTRAGSSSQSVKSHTLTVCRPLVGAGIQLSCVEETQQII